MNRKKVSKDCSFICGTGIGTIVSLIVTLLLAVASALMIVNEYVNESAMSFVTFITISLSVFIGAVVGCKLVGGKWVLVAAAIAAAYMLVLVAVGLLIFDGTLTGILSGIFSALLGFVLTCAVCISTAGKGRKRKYRPR